MCRCLSILPLGSAVLLLSSCGVFKPDGVLGDVLEGRAHPPSKEEEQVKRDLKREMCSQLSEEPGGMTIKVDL